MFWRILATTACVLVLASCQQQPAGPSTVRSATAPTAAAVQHEQDVPFAGDVKGVVIYDPSNPKGCAAVPGQPFAITTRSEGTGNALHMGAVDFDAGHCQTPQGMLGDWVMTGANGDKVVGTYVAFRVGGGPLVVGEWFHLSAAVAITGGTGRFRNATGTANML